MPDGMEVGGGGLFATTEDNFRLMKLYADGGVWEGERILAEDYVRLAVCTMRMSVLPLIASAIMAAVSLPVYWLLTLWVSPKLAVLPAILVAVAAYLAAAIVTKVITIEDVEHLPKGHKIAKLLRLK